MEIAFPPEVLEVYLRVLNPVSSQEVRNFHKELAKVIMEHGNRFWLIQRTCFNHLMLLFSLKPHLT